MTEKKIEKESIKKEAFTLTELVDLDKLQQIQDTFAESSQVAATIIELDGTPITRLSNHSRVCTMVRATESGLANCMVSGEQLGLEAAKRMQPFHKACLSCGFTDAAAPIIVNGVHIANWMIGQYHVGNVDEEHIRDYAREIGADEEEMAAAFRDMPKISAARFEKILSFLWLMANEISNMGYLNLMQKRQAAELFRVQTELEQHQAELEKKVQERTAELSSLNLEFRREIRRKNRVQQEQGILITAIEHTAEAVVITDTIPRIIYVNPSFTTITGYSAAEVVGKNPNLLQSGHLGREFYQDMWQTITSGNVWLGRFINRTKEGRIYQENATISPVKNREGAIVNYVCIKRDVTQELAIEQQLLQSSKLEAIGTLAAGIAHEINTPLQYVRDNTQFLEGACRDLFALHERYRRFCHTAAAGEMFAEEVAALTDFEEEIDLAFITEETTKAIRESLGGLQGIAAIVKAMKEFSHPGSPDKHPEDINQLIRSTVTVSRSEWKHCADISLALDQDLPSVSVFSGQIKQVLLNIIVNAAQAIASTTADSPEEKGRITIATSRETKCVRVVVSDTGTGMPKSVLDKIFDPFFTTKTVGKGTGQGLSMAYTAIVEGHGGTLSVTSEEGKGTDLILTLPL